MNRLALNVISLAVFALLGVAPVRAASLQKVEQGTWSVSGLPSYVNMYIYLPDKLAAKPPILVASHHCQGTGTSTFNETKSTLVSLADKNGFVMIFPEATGHNCWDVGSAKSLKHDGGGDTQAIAQMVRYALVKYDGDPSRVYAFGGSSGAMMTEALLGVYPDMFMAGVSVAGVPCGCWAEQYTGDSGSSPQWSGPCAGGNVSKTAQQWGDLVRSMYPGYTGHRPRVQLWHGTADTTISYKNLGESVKEWTNLLGLHESPSATDTAKSGYTHQTWKNTCSNVSLETWAQQGAGHDVSWDPASVAGFLGLDHTGGQDPEAAACPGTASTGGAAGRGNSAGSSGSSGAAGSLSSPGAASPNAGAAAISGASGHVSANSAAAVSGDGGEHSAQAGAGAGGAAASSPGIATAPDGASASSSGGCSCAVGARGALPTTNFAALVFGVLCARVRRRAYWVSVSRPGRYGKVP